MKSLKRPMRAYVYVSADQTSAGEPLAGRNVVDIIYKTLDSSSFKLLFKRKSGVRGVEIALFNEIGPF